MSAVVTYAPPIMAVLLGALWFWRRFIRLPHSHRRRIRAADRALAKLAKIPSPAARFAWLRKMDPFTFEEMILTALKREGAKITRNRRYTGDGGSDGQAEINGQRYFIQAKRYRGHINVADVNEFAALCAQSGVKGLFVHTGKTGKGTVLAMASGIVRIVSGDGLIKLFDPDQSFTAQFTPIGNREASE